MNIDFTKVPFVKLSAGQKSRCATLYEAGSKDDDLLKYVLSILKSKSYFKNIFAISFFVRAGVIECAIDKNVKKADLSIASDDDDEQVIMWVDWSVTNE